MQRRRPWWIWAAGILVVVVAGGAFAFWYRFVRKDQKPVDVAAVEDRFRSQGAGGTARAGVPALGVYLYDTTGEESVNALGGQTNRYPATTTLTVTATDCGIDAQWDVLTGRSTTSARCRAADGTWTLASSTVSDRFFNQTQVDTYTCRGVVELPADPEAGATDTGTCRSGPNTSRIETEVVGRPKLRIGGREVETVRLRITTTQGGDRSGGGTEDRWVLPDTNLVVRSRVRERDVSPSPVGQVTYEQRYEITLRSLDPQT